MNERIVKINNKILVTGDTNLVTNKQIIVVDKEDGKYDLLTRDSENNGKLKSIVSTSDSPLPDPVIKEEECNYVLADLSKRTLVNIKENKSYSIVDALDIIPSPFGEMDFGSKTDGERFNVMREAIESSEFNLNDTDALLKAITEVISKLVQKKDFIYKVGNVVIDTCLAFIYDDKKIVKVGTYFESSDYSDYNMVPTIFLDYVLNEIRVWVGSYWDLNYRKNLDLTSIIKQFKKLK